MTSQTVAVRPELPGGRPAAAALELRDITKTYPGTNALTGVGFVLRRHQMLGLVGENGAGKSTLLSIINGTVRPDSGTISINGEAVRFGHPTEAARAGVATVFQEQGLIPNIPVFENIFLGREDKFCVAGALRRKAMIAEARAVLEELEVDVSPTALTGALSFGQRQLVEIAKAFALSRSSCSTNRPALCPTMRRRSSSTASAAGARALPSCSSRTVSPMCSRPATRSSP